MPFHHDTFFSYQFGGKIVLALFLFADCKWSLYKLHVICLHNIYIFHDLRHPDFIVEKQDKNPPIYLHCIFEISTKLIF